jgi:hypothetical protein
VVEVSAGCARGRRSSGQDGAACDELERPERVSPAMASGGGERLLRCCCGERRERMRASGVGVAWTGALKASWRRHAASLPAHGHHAASAAYCGRATSAGTREREGEKAAERAGPRQRRGAGADVGARAGSWAGFD